MRIVAPLSVADGPNLLAAAELDRNGEGNQMVAFRWRLSNTQNSTMKEPEIMIMSIAFPVIFTLFLISVTIRASGRHPDPPKAVSLFCMSCLAL